MLTIFLDDEGEMEMAIPAEEITEEEIQRRIDEMVHPYAWTMWMNFRAYEIEKRDIRIYLADTNIEER